MPLNKLENFIKNTDGRTLYVNPNDLNATDSITNQGTSLTEPFRTIQRALIESARFSYVRGDDNDLIERTTIMVYPGEHPIDNRPGFGIKTVGNSPVAVTPSGELIDPFQAFNLTDASNFDIESSNNVLYRFNSIYGGVVVPRGTSIVGMDLRKTKIRPIYVPNPTDDSVDYSAIFRITGTCYFWQFTIFDGNENGVVFTDPRDFSENNQSRPTFSHHKLTAFEYADGVNPAVESGFELTDLAMYYSKLSNAYNEASGRPIDEKYPSDPGGFSPQRPEFEIVGAFATDPINITRLISGDGFVPDAVITVDTQVPHELNTGTPIKIRGVAISDYNISTKVSAVLSPTRFTYNLSFVRPNLPAEPSVSSATVTVETDTVTGASPYIFNCSMRSVWGINGMHADGAKATGFRSMVVAQFTAISLQKDDRSFVTYNKQARRYDGINVNKTVRGAELSAQSSSTNSATVYHLDPDAIYRPDWGTTHIKMSNDAVIQIVSVFAIGFNQHFASIGGADASITNSNSNFGQFALKADGFKNDAFLKDDKGFLTSFVSPKSAYNPETDDVEIIDWINIDFDLTRSIAFANQLYLTGYTNAEDKPPVVNQGFRIGANYKESLIQRTTVGAGADVTSSVRMCDNILGPGNNQANGSSVARKVYQVLAGPINNTLSLGVHGLLNGESVRVFSSTGDLPENLERGALYYANVVDGENIRIATSESNALNNIFLNIYGGVELRVESRVNDKEAGERGHPVQYDYTNQNWFVHTDANSDIYQYIVANPTSTDGIDFVSIFKRFGDNRALEDKLYRLRYVIPKESRNAKPPTPGYVLQASATTGARNNDDFILQDIGINDYEYNRNPRYIVSCTVIANEVEVRSEIPHNLNVGDKIKIVNVASTNNTGASQIKGFNGEFLVTRVINSREFRYDITDVNGFSRNPGTFTNNINERNILLPRYERKDLQSNVFVYRIETITDFLEGERDGIYHLFLLNGSNPVTETFTDIQYNQPVEDLYPQMDPDNLIQNPPATTTFAKRAPLGDVTIDEQQNSITKESVDKIYKTLNVGIIETATDGTVGAGGTRTTTLTFQREHEFNSVYSYTTLVGGGGYTDGTFYDVKLLSEFGTVWGGASAVVTVTAGTVTAVTIMDPGSGYSAGQTLFIDGTTIGGGTNATISITQADLEDNKHSILQISGGALYNPDSYVVMTSVEDQSSVGVARTSGSPAIIPGMYAYPADSGTGISSTTYNSDTGLTTLVSTGSAGFGLQRGNTFVVFSSNYSYLGKFFVSNVPTPDTLEFYSYRDLGTVSIVGKTGLDVNDANTGSLGENVGVRATPLYDNGVFYLEQSSGTGTQLTVRAEDGGVAGNVDSKMYLGRYFQMGSEIIRVASKNFDGANNNIVTVIRGALGTVVSNLPINTKVKAIRPSALELRRPSILRASGHTFEYLGYGPGNYSTSLPQLQVKQLPDDEIYLVQAQELSCGQVVYTGMSDNGDFYIGNTKYSATSGTQSTFDVPIPTVAGQPGSSNNVVFDEVIINRRLFVSGGETNEVQSQFDGPVKFTQSVTIQNNLFVTGTTQLNRIEITSTENATSSANGGALTIRGGAAIGKDFYVGGEMYTNAYQIEDTSAVLEIGTNQSSKDISVGGSTDTDRVVFNTTKLATGEGAEEVVNADAGVVVEGGLVVRDVIIAKEFRGAGTGGGPGTILLWGGSTSALPDRYLLCNGATLNKNTYNKLFEAIGYIHGGSGNSFKLPDLRNRFIPGAGSSYAVAAKGGDDSVVLTETQMPRHTHSTSAVNAPHTHPVSFTSGAANAPHKHPAGTGGGGNHNHPSGGTGGGGNHNHPSGGSNNTGNHGHPYSAPGQSKTDVANSNEKNVTSNVNASGAGTGGGGAHSHSVSVNSTSSAHNHPVSVNSGSSAHNHPVSVNSANAPHSHPISGNAGSANAPHVHPIGNTGGTASFDNRPKYYALCYIIQSE
ncbi:putative short tail fiber [Synechococcus phage ACG-2014f]|uniref:Putative short tail fiber n=1 Tax=Synechococcus phage ACG-2014f TaxID=1493511 RepID=A0A0E3HIK0_9CAUD|nr:putative short tail fiber [Synechococcus phage ACG-2014f]AIX32222.1 putative short tail fiber [Synechococcus phage ACG-2014f]